MTGFLIAAGVVLALVVVLLLRPFLRRSRATEATLTQRQMNAGIYRDQMARLDQDLADGTLSPQDHAASREELQRRALEDLAVDEARASAGAPRKTMAALAALVPIAGIGLYVFLGNTAGLDPQVAAQGGKAPHQDAAEIERMVTNFRAKLEANPGDKKGWSLLARSYKVMGRMKEAEEAYDRAGDFIDNDSQELANYADTVASNAGGFTPKAVKLIDKAVKADPKNPMALWLAGTAALQAKDYDGAIGYWQRVAQLVPPESDDAREIAGAIADARARSGKPAAGTTVAANAPAQRSDAPAAAAAGLPTGSVSGTVELAPALKAKAQPGDTVMVIARAPGQRMPLAVLRAKASELPMKFVLDDSLAMMPSARISGVPQVEVEVRISRTGMATPEPGDLISAVQTVKVGARDVNIQVAQVRP